MRRVLACVFTGKCTRETGGLGCQTCPDYFPVEGRIMGEEVFCYQCVQDEYKVPNPTCEGCTGQSLFTPTEAARKYTSRIVRYLEGHPGATLDEARGHKREV